MIKRIAFMFTVFALAATTVLAVGDGKEKAFVMPTKAEIRALIENPESISELSTAAKEQHIARILVEIVSAMEEDGKTDAEIAAVLNALLSSVAEARGAAFGSAVMVRIRKKVSPRVLPIVPAGSRAYRGQRARAS